MHDPAVLWLVMKITAAHGHTKEVAKVLVCGTDLRHDAVLLGYVRAVVSKPPHHSGRTLFERAVKRGDCARASEILAACPHNAARAALLAGSETYSTPFSRMLNASDCDYSGPMALLLLDSGATVTTSSLSAAASTGRRAILEAQLAVLARGTDEARLRVLNGGSGTSVFTHIFDRGRRFKLSAAAIPLLLSAGADPLATTYDGEFDAFDACVFKSNSGGVLAALLDALSSDEVRHDRVNQSDGEGRTLLMRAFTSEHARLLLRAGADVYAVDDEGRDVFDHALREDEDGRWPDTVEVLLAALRNKTERRERATRANEEGLTLLMRADGGTHAQALLDAGADVWAVDADGHDALWHAQDLEHEYDSTAKCVPELVAALGRRHRAARERVNRADEDGVTPLMRARCARDARALLDAGADVEAVDDKEHNAFDHYEGWEYAGYDGNEHLKVLLSALPRDTAEQCNGIRELCRRFGLRAKEVLA